jgi:hypothetical protein
MIYVVNKKTFKRKSKDCAFYVGRPSVLGNPFEIGKDGIRQAVIQKYKDYIDRHLHNLSDNNYLSKQIKIEISNLVALAKISDLYLVCWCAPESCHADIIKEILEKRLNKDER